MTDPTTKPERVAEVFWTCGGLDSTHLSLLDELGHERDPRPRGHLISLVSKAPSDLALSNPLFACHVIEAVSDQPEMRRALLDALVLNATPRSWSRTLGEPAPVWVTLRDESQRLADRYPAVADLFNALRRYAERRIREDEAGDNETS